MSELTYAQKSANVNAIAMPLAPEALATKLYKCVKKGRSNAQSRHPTRPTAAPPSLSTAAISIATFAVCHQIHLQSPMSLLPRLSSQPRRQKRCGGA